MKENLKESLEKLIRGTLSGKIHWTKPSEHVFIWQTANSDQTRLNVILQGYKLVNNQVTDIIFRLWDVENKASLIDIKADDSGPEVKMRIVELYNVVKDNSDVGRVDILNDLLKDI